MTFSNEWLVLHAFPFKQSPRKAASYVDVCFRSLWLSLDTKMYRDLVKFMCNNHKDTLRKRGMTLDNN